MVAKKKEKNWIENVLIVFGWQENEGKINRKCIRISSSDQPSDTDKQQKPFSSDTDKQPIVVLEDKSPNIVRRLLLNYLVYQIQYLSLTILCRSHDINAIQLLMD